MKTDEDLYPTLLETFFRLQSPQSQSLTTSNYAEIFGWNNNLEHAFLSTTNTSARRSELALYESSRVNTDHETNQ